MISSERGAAQAKRAEEDLAVFSSKKPAAVRLGEIMLKQTVRMVDLLKRYDKTDGGGARRQTTIPACDHPARMRPHPPATLPTCAVGLYRCGNDGEWYAGGRGVVGAWSGWCAECGLGWGRAVGVWMSCRCPCFAGASLSITG